ncbi:MAG TPA: YdeI/OmpD-associated family protein [Saprospiraceae bacterium]|nr:YdeI/OmpD-associated family protein [Saprospiraceae bacterium]HPN71281.1 YdeI/OmpD-associated family protein [Saprospiraceae bacterium]
MAQLDEKVSEYIANSADFAQPILKHWRQLIHENCPEVIEAIKWSIPHFDYKGDFICVMSSYKNHCSFTFIKAELMSDSRLKESKSLKPIQRFMGKITRLADLPPDQEFIKLLQEAMVLNEKGIKIVVEKSDKPKVYETPDYFDQRLSKKPLAKEIFESKSNSFRKEYIIWILEAKTKETRQKRIDEAVDWISEGKSRFWKSKK